MRVAIIPPVAKTGILTSSRHLIQGLRARDVDVRILHHFALNTTHRRVFLGSLLLKRLIKDNSISLVHDVGNLGPFLLRHKDLRTKKVLTVHDIAPLMLQLRFERIVRDRVGRWDFTTVLPRLIQNTDLIIVHSYSTMTDLIAKFQVAKEKLVVVHQGVDTSFFQPINNYSQVLNKYGLRHNFLLFVGADSARKNLQTLVRAYVSIFHEISDDLVLVGPISKNKIRTYINLSDIPLQLKKDAHKRIILLGYVRCDDLPSIYSAATALIFPSLYEGFGLPPLEAMACNVPVVLSDNSSLREIAGNAGFYIDHPLDSENISRNILEVVNDESLRERLRFEGYKQARRFSWEKTVQKTIDAYESIL
jgi:glycosyltransferase involved in cell wall biosynthesis